MTLAPASFNIGLTTSLLKIKCGGNGGEEVSKLKEQPLYKETTINILVRH
jgi:hypothetical protein